MKYVLLLYSEEEKLPENMPDAEREVFRRDFGEFNAALQQKGAFVDAIRLRRVETATSVVAKNGQTLITDGPFAETKESLAGLFVIDCADLDEALDWAKRIPTARHGTVEVRPAWEDYGS